MGSKLSTFLAELKRRKVYRVAVVYVAVGVGIVGAGEAGLPPGVWERLQIPIGVLILAGLPIALVLAWAYEVKPEEPRIAVTPRSDESRKSIVVLPFDNMSPDPGDAYFSDGLTEEIITNLSHLKALRVISRSSAMVLKEAQKDIRAIGKELDVGYVLEGSVRKAGDHLRITAQLIDAETDAHLWAEKYEGILDDVFGIQERVSKSIVEVLNLKLTAGEKEELLERRIEDPRAYECYLRAWHELNLGSRESYDRAITTLENGLRLYGEDALLLATLGTTFFWIVDVGIESDTGLLDRARELAERALSIDPTSPHGKSLLANLERRGGNLTTCARLIMEAHKADPNDPSILLLAGMFTSWYVGQNSVSEALFDRLLAIDPLTPINYLMSGFFYLGSTEHRAKGLDYIRKAWEMGLELPWARFWIAYALAVNGRTDEAIQELEDALEDGLPDPTAPMARFFLGALRGDSRQALAAFDPDTRAYAWADPDFPFICSGMFALMNETKDALAWIQHSLDRGNINYPLFARDPLLESLRGDPRFEQLMVDLKPRWEAFEF